MRRRTFLKSPGLLAFPFAVASPARADDERELLVCVFLRGGADGLNIVVPFADPGYYQLRPTIGVATPGEPEGVVDLDGFFGLHPCLAPLNRHYVDGSLALVHATGLRGGSHSHFEAQDFMERGITESTGDADGWVNRFLAAASPTAGDPDQIRGVSFGTALPLSMRGGVELLALRSLDDVGLSPGGPRGQLLAQALEAVYAATTPLDAAAQQALASIETIGAIGETPRTPANGASYPNSTFGTRFSDLAALIDADVDLEAAWIDMHGWDDHAAENASLPARLDDLARTLDAFATDMDGRMSRITIAVLSEFGRRAYENASGGTDHGFGNAMMFLGGGVEGGRVYGNWPGLGGGELAFHGDLPVTTDCRTVLSEYMRKRRGLADIAAVFPDFVEDPELGLFKNL